jgi:hypothetical protein
MSRIWDLPQDKLCRQHLLGEWREALGVWSVINNNKKGYSRHPEILRWINNTEGLYNKLKEIRNEMLRRGYSPKEIPQPVKALVNGKFELVNTIEEQIINIRNKGCECSVSN